MNKLIASTIVAASLSVGAAYADESAGSPYVTIRSLTAPLATKLALAAYEDCTAKGHNVTVAVVGRDGRVLALVRSPLSGPHTIEVSQGKAYTATTFRAATTAHGQGLYERYSWRIDLGWWFAN